MNEIKEAIKENIQCTHVEDYYFGENSNINNAVNDDLKVINEAIEFIKYGQFYNDLEYVKKLKLLIDFEDIYSSVFYKYDNNNYYIYKIKDAINNIYGKYGEIANIKYEYEGDDPDWGAYFCFDFVIIILKKLPSIYTKLKSFSADELLQLEKDGYIVILKKEYAGHIYKSRDLHSLCYKAAENYFSFDAVKDIFNFDYSKNDLELFDEKKKNVYNELLKHIREEFNIDLFKKYLLQYIKNVINTYNRCVIGRTDYDMIRKNRENLEFVRKKCEKYI